ncbi:MAG TPA: redox-sensing transcriptional repressor Rex [Anaerolineales bacterium]|nr:redox-sensing transcriptional repressor Rex [Anaerolineales bacterium]
MPEKVIPDIVVGRLPLYLRTLQTMGDQGRQVTSSQELGEYLGISAAQIRKDLSQFGEFGKQGTGYNIPYLSEKLSEILKVNRSWEVAVVGAGDIGRALARYSGFSDRGFHVTRIFDSDPNKIGMEVGEFTVHDAADLVEEIRSAGIRVAMLAVPAIHAQEVTENLIEAGVQAILNYAPVILSVPPSVRVQHIDPAVHLQRMTYYLD